MITEQDILDKLNIERINPLEYISKNPLAGLCVADEIQLEPIDVEPTESELKIKTLENELENTKDIIDFLIMN